MVMYMSTTNLQKKHEQCVFCSLPEIKNRIIIQNDLVRAFPTNIPITEGHILIAPIRCVKSLDDMTTEEKLAVFDMADRIMDVLRKVFKAEGFNCAWNQEKLAGQSVPHFHLHVIPRKEGDTGLIGYDPRSMLYRTGDRETTDESVLIKVAHILRLLV